MRICRRSLVVTVCLKRVERTACGASLVTLSHMVEGCGMDSR